MQEIIYLSLTRAHSLSLSPIGQLILAQNKSACGDAYNVTITTSATNWVLPCHDLGKCKKSTMIKKSPLFVQSVGIFIHRDGNFIQINL
jgi:hypothetical protein